MEPDDEVRQGAAHAKEILRAAAEHDIPSLKKCLDAYAFENCESVDVQDPDTGFSPLHAAISGCRTITPSGSLQSGKTTVATNDTQASSSELTNGTQTRGVETVQYLLENGAIWNQLNNRDETPGCLARRLGFEQLYQMMVDAGVRAEVLLNRLDGYEELQDEEENEDEDPATDGAPSETSADPQISVGEVGQVTSKAYLSSTLSLTVDKLLDEQQNGVMMEWERGIMQQSADAILGEAGLKVLNVGFGMGIIDTYIQQHPNKPAEHHIIEAHPDVLADMQKKGWSEMPGLTIHAGKWQDVLPQLVAEGETFDAIYFDTFAESYGQFREFVSENVIGLLTPSGKWSFFNGMGADRQISYDVYQKVVEMDMFESGFDVEWTEIALPPLEKAWEGVRRKYWDIEKYRLPLCKFMD